MGSFILFILLLPLLLLLYFAFVYRRSLLGIYRMREQYKEAQRQAEEEQERRERVRKQTEPEQSSVERIKDASIDLDGGEYVDYEEVKE
ncbi:DUF4834 family protein [Porphyromonas levii]|uniref:DUF4834 family protein n=1 Tax=Porphyromonas levii TaxID=28114 RepID=UPI000363ECA6|nr:DUF4834 family protein [Porphyromonas levii]MBR8702936.1 hypothetical protein [Porphyromonas levii]MBR8729721.1 hypothetical protein [Porphyromonas levii]MBR8731468.1 hypothetical protein [Porphyromonas levii]MBR8759162.1 hypothetical protein [Porphyromonas levii]MBR8763647.1 hypothetical protein [Porphyromonas levii]